MSYVEPPITRHLQNKATHLRIPVNGTFELSPRCNFRCPMCYVHLSGEELAATGRRLLSASEWLALAKDAREAGLLYLLLTGGEPFLRSDFREIYEALAKMGFILSINTNASLIDDETVAWLSACPPSRINITLYGASNESYARLCGCPDGFDRVTAAIFRLQKAGIPVKLSGSLTPLNVEDLPALVTFSRQHALVFEVATYMFPPIRKGEEHIGHNRRFTPEETAHYRLEAARLQMDPVSYRTYLQGLADGLAPSPLTDECAPEEPNGHIQCRAGRASFWVTWDGAMSPCGMLTTPQVQPLTEGFSAAWKRLTDETDTIRLSSQCAACQNRKICHVCAAMELCENGVYGKLPVFLCAVADHMRVQAETELNRLNADRNGDLI